MEPSEAKGGPALLLESRRWASHALEVQIIVASMVLTQMPTNLLSGNEEGIPKLSS